MSPLRICARAPAAADGSVGTWHKKALAHACHGMMAR